MVGTGGHRPGAGRPPFVPTDEQRKFVLYRIGLGAPLERVANKLGISLPSLHKHFKQEVLNGVEEANRCVAGNLYKAATCETVTPAVVSAMMFWLARRDGWHEKDTLDVTVQTVTDKPMTALEWGAKFAAKRIAPPQPIEDASFTELPANPKADADLKSALATVEPANVPNPGKSW